MKVILNLCFLFVLTTAAEEECPPGKFFNNEQKQCELCINNCNLCTTAQNCVICFNGYILHKGLCQRPRKLEEADPYDDDNYYRVTDEEVAQALEAYSPEQASGTINQILNDLQWDGGEVNFGKSLLTVVKNLFIEQLDFSQWTTSFKNFSDADKSVSIEHYIKYFTAVDNYLKLFTDSGEDFSIERFNFSSWAQSAVCRWTTFTKNLNWAELVEKYEYENYDDERVKDWLRVSDVNWDILTEFNWNYSDIAENVLVNEVESQWTKQKIQQIKQDFQWNYLDPESSDLVDELHQLNFSLLDQELANIQTIKEDYQNREQLGIAGTNFANYLNSYQFTILKSNDILNYNDVLIYEEELKEFSRFKPYFQLSYLTFNLTELVKRFNLTIENQEELNFMNKLLQLDLSELENSYIIKDNLTDEYYMLKEQNLQEFNLTLVAKKLNYTFNQLSEGELNGISTLLHKNDREFFTRLILAMKLQDAVNSIEDKSYSAIDLVQIGTALNISATNKAKLQELNDIFLNNFDAIKGLINNQNLNGMQWGQLAKYRLQNFSLAFIAKDLDFAQPYLAQLQQIDTIFQTCSMQELLIYMSYFPDVNWENVDVNAVTQIDYYIANTIMFRYFISRLLHMYQLTATQEAFLQANFDIVEHLLTYARKGSFPKEEKVALVEDVFKAFRFRNLTDFDLYYLNKTDGMVKFDLTSMVEFPLKLDSLSKTQIVSLISKTTRFFDEIESLERHMNNNILANMQKFNLSAYYQNCSEAEECYLSFYNETYANITNLLVEFLQNFTKVDIADRLFDFDEALLSEFLEQKFYWHETLDRAKKIFEVYVNGMVDITVNGTTGAVSEQCRADTIPGCKACRIENICKSCIYGSPFSLSYEVDGKKMYGLCECPSGYYKTSENVCESLGEVDLEDALDEERISSSSYEELVITAQIAKSAGIPTKQTAILQSVQNKLSTEGAVSGSELSTMITICESVNTTTMDENSESSIVNLLADISDNAAFTSEGEFQQIWAYGERILPEIKSNENQKAVEDKVFKQLSKNFIEIAKTDLETQVKSIELESGTMEFAKVSGEKQFSTTSVNYPTKVLNEIGVSGDSYIVVNVKVIKQNKIPMKESSAVMKGDPITIENYIVTTEGTTDPIANTLSEPFTLCFDWAQSQSEGSCVYWDEQQQIWSAEGITTTAGGCCESLHFSTFGIISPTSEQIVPIVNTNPGEYHNNNLCQTLTPGCLECQPETGVCVLCEGYTPLIDGACLCLEGRARFYDSATYTWSCKAVDEITVPEITLTCESVTEAQLYQLKEGVYSALTDSNQILGFLTSLQQCQANFEALTGLSIAALLSLETDILIGAVKKSFIVDSSSLEKAFAISQLILNNLDADINVYKKLAEFYGLANKQIYDGSFAEPVASDIQTDLSDFFTATLQKMLSKNAPLQTQPNNYRFTNFWVRIGKVVPEQFLLSKLYREKYMVQVQKHLFESVLETSSYYIHFLSEETPFRQPSESNLVKFVQYFNMYDVNFVSLGNSLFEHCSDGVILVYPYYEITETKNPFTLLSYSENAWSPKVICYTDEQIAYQKMCNPANLNSQYYYGITLDYSLPLPPAVCDTTDIPLCQSCNSEMECTNCLFGNVLIGGQYEYYGRCECPKGEYKYSFSTTDCNKTEYIGEAFDEFLQQFDDIISLDDLFADRAFMVVELDRKQAYLDYLEKLITLPINSIEEIENAVNVLNVLSQGLFLTIEEYFLTLLQNIVNTIKLNNYDMDDKLYFKLSADLIEAQLLEFGNINFQMTEEILNKIRAECSSDFILSGNIMSVEGNPFDLIQSISLLSGLAELQFFCQDSSSIESHVIDLTLNQNQFFTLVFNDFSLGSQTPACVYWNNADQAWSSEGQIFEESYYKCTFESLKIMGIITEGSQQYLCDSKCSSCIEYMHCTSCQTGYFLLQNYCYDRYTMPLDIILETDSTVYLMSYQDEQCLLAESETSYSFQPCDASSIIYKKFQWIVQKNGIYYKFTNRFYTNLYLNYNNMEWFSLIKLADDPDYGDIYTNEVKFLPMNHETCLDISFAVQDCSLAEKSLFWEFYPLSQNYHDGIDFNVEIEVSTDVVVISFAQNESPNVVYYLAKTYTENTDQLTELACSSINSNSPANFNFRENDLIIEASLSDLVKCDYELDTSNPSIIKLTGAVVHVFQDTKQIYHSSLEITLSSQLDIQQDIISNAAITGVLIGSQGGTMLEQYFIADVALEGGDDSDILEVDGSFVIIISLPNTAASSYNLELPNTAKMTNLYHTYELQIALESSQNNKFKVSVDIGDYPVGSYRLKFTGTLILLGLNRFLEQDSETATLIIDKELKLQNISTKQNNSTNNATKATQISNVTQETIDKQQDDSGIDLVTLVIIMSSCMCALILLIGIGFYTRKIAKSRFNQQQSSYQTESIQISQNSKIVKKWDDEKSIQSACFEGEISQINQGKKQNLSLNFDN